MVAQFTPMNNSRNGRLLLDGSHTPAPVKEILDGVRSKVVCDESILTGLEQVLTRWMCGRHSTNRPIGSFLWFGPSGVGKTYTVQVLADTLHGSPSKVLIIDCGEYTHGHETARLVGAPPGYLGHGETAPVFTTERIVSLRSSNCPISLILFDEIEKAHPDMYAILLGILDRGVITIGKNQSVDLTNTMIFFTSNLAHEKILHRTTGIGYNQHPTADTILDSVRNAAVKHFGSPFVNRIDVVAVWRPLLPEDLIEVSKLELAKSTTGLPYRVRFSDAAISWIANRGYDSRMGARHIRRNVDTFVMTPLARLELNKRIPLGSEIEIDCSPNGEHLEIWQTYAAVSTSSR